MAKATKRDTAAVAKCRDVVEGLMGEFLQASALHLLCAAFICHTLCRVASACLCLVQPSHDSLQARMLCQADRAATLLFHSRSQGIAAAVLQFDLRNGSIRKKYDSLKYTLRKMENTLYELSLAEAGYKRREDADEVRRAAAPQHAAKRNPMHAHTLPVTIRSIYRMGRHLLTPQVVSLQSDAYCAHHVHERCCAWPTQQKDNLSGCRVSRSSLHWCRWL